MVFVDVEVDYFKVVCKFQGEWQANVIKANNGDFFFMVFQCIKYNQGVLIFFWIGEFMGNGRGYIFCCLCFIFGKMFLFDW